MTEPLDPSPSHDRTAGATVTLPVPPSVALAVVTDLGSFPAWLDMHSGWRGRAPGRAVVGLQFVEQVQLMGIPAEVQWEVVEVGDDRLGLEGSGPMELTLALLVTLAPRATERPSDWTSACPATPCGGRWAARSCRACRRRSTHR